MSKKFNFSRSIGKETFQIEGCDSFDEARKIVDKAVYERQLQLDAEVEAKKPKVMPPSNLPGQTTTSAV